MRRCCYGIQTWAQENGVFAKYSEVEEVFIFGSRAKGNYKKGSDIDLAIKGKNISESLAGTIRGILEDEVPLPYQFDVVHYASISNPDFISHIDRVGIIFYQQKKVQ